MRKIQCNLSAKRRCQLIIYCTPKHTHKHKRSFCSIFENYCLENSLVSFNILIFSEYSLVTPSYECLLLVFILLVRDKSSTMQFTEQLQCSCCTSLCSLCTLYVHRTEAHHITLALTMAMVKVISNLISVQTFPTNTIAHHRLRAQTEQINVPNFGVQIFQFKAFIRLYMSASLHCLQ